MIIKIIHVLIRSLLTIVILALPARIEPADWSSDGKKLLFWADWSANLEVYVINVDGTGLRNLTNHPAEDANPVWSPDGKLIAFYSKRDGNGEVYVMNDDGKNLTNLTQHPAHDFNPTWSPAGIRLVFQSYRDGHGQIYMMNADGSEQKNISGNNTGETNPDWSPDRGRIVYVSDRNGRRGIYLMNSDGSEQQMLIESDFMDLLNPKWASDGSKIVFHSFFKDFGIERGAIYVMNDDGSDITKLTGDNLYHFNPFFSPDDRHISFNVADHDGTINIYVMAVDGSVQINVTKMAARSN